MVCSVISAKVMGHLYNVEGAMRQDQCMKVLKNCLVSQVEEWFFGDDEYVFMHNSASYYKARSVTAFLG